MSKKDKCKELMVKYFGPATGALVDEMGEDEVVEKCRTKVAAFLGEDAAKAFDSL